MYGYPAEDATKIAVDAIYDEKNQVKNNVDNANKDKFPEGTTVTVGDDGTATVNYPDGSKDTIPGDQLVQGQKGSMSQKEYLLMNDLLFLLEN